MTRNNKKNLPNRRYHKVPRPLQCDAYTVNGYAFESGEATENSKYYGTFRKFPLEFEPSYTKGDERIVFSGLQSLCDLLFYEPITHDEINETVAFLKGRKVKNNGTFADFEFPEVMWRRVVDEFGGFLPLRVDGMPEGSVVYPHEPFLRVTATEPGFGPLVPWFESTLLHVWAATERLTAARHFMRYTYDIIRKYEPQSVTDAECEFFSRVMIHDFGDRGATSPMESELVGKVHNYIWYGSDTFRAAFQNWKNGAPAAFGSSVKALAHRIVQGYQEETDCYNSMYDTANGNELLSMVGDCYDYWAALKNDLIPLALKAQKDGGKANTIVARPDSGNSTEMVLGTLNAANEAGLMEDHLCADGVTRKVATTLRYIVGNGESFASVLSITQSALDAGYVPWRCGVYGIGGHLRNNINRDHLSTKFALCSVGHNERPVIKLSNTPGKQTLPECNVLRSKDALKNGVTICLPSENNGEDALVSYYNGSLETPFGSGFTDDFMTCENRVVNDFKRMPESAGRQTASLVEEVDELIKHYRG